MSAQPKTNDAKKQVYKPKAISGFPEWLPEIRLIEQQWMDHIRTTFESYGFCSIETPSVEELDVLTAKGETDKEIYTLTRLQADENDDKEARLGLHFDQTVPLARYVAQHFNDLTFPFKRYQIQRVWRGERPQLGRAREFYQCDIDVINVDHLPLHFDAEMPAVIYEALMGLDIGRVQIKLNNRKILFGVLDALNISDHIHTTRIIDKLEKIGEDGVRQQLSDDIGLSADQIDQLIKFAGIKSSDSSFKEQVEALGFGNDTLSEGLEELAFVVNNLKHLPDDAIVVDLSIVRGLDYYTGTVYETRLLDIPEFTSSVCSGGRYDDLASNYINRHLPGVGISIGFTRLFEVLHHYGHIKGMAKSPADILMVLPNEDARSDVAGYCAALRQRGFKVEMYHAPQKIKKQLGYAEKKGIPFVWFPPFEDGQDHEVKNMNTGAQDPATPDSWTKPE